MISVKIITDSICHGTFSPRLTTVVATYPRFIHSELLTHRVFSRNSASSRAIPIDKDIEQVSTTPAIPIHWGANQRGMQAEGEITDKDTALEAWLRARDSAVYHATELKALGLHKQIVNRVLEPFFLITTIITATEWENFLKLRTAPPAQPEIRELALKIQKALNSSTPQDLDPDTGLHAPFIQPDETHLPLLEQAQLSAARSARVSYLTHEGKRDHDKDFELFNRLVQEGHWSPLEHVARPVNTFFHAADSNFAAGWKQLRKSYEEQVLTVNQDAS